LDDYYPVYAAEPEYIINEKAGNLLNKPIPNANITLPGTGKYRLFKDKVSDLNGGFAFKELPIVDSPYMYCRPAKQKEGSLTRV